MLGSSDRAVNHFKEHLKERLCRCSFELFGALLNYVGLF